MSKIISIKTVGNGSSRIFALTDDGRVFEHYDSLEHWIELPSLPSPSNLEKRVFNGRKEVHPGDDGCCEACGACLPFHQKECKPADKFVVPPIDLDRLWKDIPDGHWVAISRDLSIALAHGETIQGVIDFARALGESNPVITRVYRGAVVL